ncbi:MAG: hypothetical protein ABI876_14940 [Bacteroidota bacterium]
MIESAEEFVRLRCSEDPDLYTRAAWEEAPEEIWHELLLKYHDDPDMRFGIALNKKLPASIIMILAKDDSWRIRYTIAQKRSVDRAVRELLSRDDDEPVRKAVAVNSKTPRDILESMVNDPVSEIAERARKRLAE